MCFCYYNRPGPVTQVELLLLSLLSRFISRELPRDVHLAFVTHLRTLIRPTRSPAMLPASLPRAKLHLVIHVFRLASRQPYFQTHRHTRCVAPQTAGSVPSQRRTPRLSLVW